MVVLAERPGGVDKHRQEILDQFLRRSWPWQLGWVIGGELVQNGRALHRSVVNRCVFMEARRRDIGQHLAVPPLEDPQPPRTSDSANDGRAHFPTLADLHHGIQHGGRNDREHPLLALARHHLERRQARLAQRHGFNVHVHAHPAPRGRFARGAGDPGAAEILDTEDEVLVEQLEGCLDQALFLERVANLDVRALCRFGFGVIGEGRRSQDAHPAYPVAPGARTKEHRQAPLAARPPENEAVLGQEPAAQDVDQRVARVTLSEVELAPDGWDPDSVAVARDTADHPARDPAVAGVVGEAEAQWVHQGDRASAHGEDVAYYPANPGSGPLVRLDRRWVVVAFDADRHGDPVPGVDHACVLARANQDGRPTVGSRRRWSLEDLYEQCSLHITAYMANSRWLGTRPRIRSMEAASSSVRPSSRCNVASMVIKLGCRGSAYLPRDTAPPARGAIPHCGSARERWRGGRALPDIRRRAATSEP